MMEFDQKGFAKEVARMIAVVSSVDEMGLRGMADEIGISASTLSRISRGHTPSIEAFAKICGWMGFLPDVFFVGQEIGSRSRQEAEWLEFMDAESGVRA